MPPLRTPGHPQVRGQCCISSLGGLCPPVTQPQTLKGEGGSREGLDAAVRCPWGSLSGQEATPQLPRAAIPFEGPQASAALNLGTKLPHLCFSKSGAREPYVGTVLARLHKTQSPGPPLSPGPAGLDSLMLGARKLCFSEPQAPSPHRPRGGSDTHSRLGACPSDVQGSLSPRSSQGALFHCTGVAPPRDSPLQPPQKAGVGSEGGPVCPSGQLDTAGSPCGGSEVQREGGKGQNDRPGAGWRRGWEDTVPRAEYRHPSQ